MLFALSDIGVIRYREIAAPVALQHLDRCLVISDHARFCLEVGLAVEVIEAVVLDDIH